MNLFSEAIEQGNLLPLPRRAGAPPGGALDSGFRAVLDNDFGLGESTEGGGLALLQSEVSSLGEL